MFDNNLPRFTPPVAGDGYMGTSPEVSPYTYLHLWDLAIAAAENVGIVLRIPKSWKFGPGAPIIGVRMVVVPGSRTLTSAEIVHTIEETFLPYGGHIAVDTTDAHGKNIHRELRGAGYPVEDFDFHERVPPKKQLRKDRGISRLRALLGDGLAMALDRHGEPLIGVDDVVKLDLSKPFGAIHLPKEWKKVRDQISLLRPDDQRQRKDAAMSLLMGGDIAAGRRRAWSRPNTASPFVVYAGRA